MKTDLTIKSKLFPPYDMEEDDINPGRFGRRLGEFVRSTLEADGIKVADLYATDYAYELRIDAFKFPVFVQIGNLDGEDSKFLISIEPKKPYVRKLFSKIPTAEAVASVYDSILGAIGKNEEVKLINEN